MPHATQQSLGLQAFILCGPGVSLNTFTSQPEDFPKALVPIANRPMVWYPLQWCYRMGVTDITLIVPTESKSALEAALRTSPSLTSLPSPKPEVLAPEDLTLTTGTAEIFRLPRIQSAITSDFIVLPCDLISELEGSRIVQQWMSLNQAVTSKAAAIQKCGLAVFYATQGLEGISGKKDETDFLATTAIASPPTLSATDSIRPNIERLLLNMPTDTLKDVLADDSESTLRLRQALMLKYGRINIKTKHRDAHAYVFPHWVKDFIARNETFDSASEDLLGWWAKAQWQEGLAAKLGLPDMLKQKKADIIDDEDQELEDDTDAYSLSTTQPTSFDSTSGPAPARTTQTPPLYAYVQPSLPPVVIDSTKPVVTPSSYPHPIIRRIDTAAALLNISLYLAKQNAEHVFGYEHKVHPTAQVGQQARISQDDSLVGENVAIGMRANIKESIIGANCEIGANAKLTRCLLMEGVTVGEGVQLTGCIVGRRARIEGAGKADSAAALQNEAAESLPKAQGKKKAVSNDDDKTRLTDCEVAPGFVVDAGTQAKGEKMMAFNTDADLDDDDDDDADEGMSGADFDDDI